MRALRALSMADKLVYFALVSIKDQVRFAFAHGGKDGHPYPVDKKTYDRSIQILHNRIAFSATPVIGPATAHCARSSKACSI